MSNCKFCNSALDTNRLYCSSVCALRFRKVGPASELSLIDAALMDANRRYEPDLLAAHLWHLSGLLPDNPDDISTRVAGRAQHKANAEARQWDEERVVVAIGGRRA